MNSLRCFFLMVTGFTIASVGQATAAEITDYCPPDAKQVTIIDLARIRASAAAKTWQGERSFNDAVKAEWFRVESNAEAEWKKMPQREAVETFFDKTSRLMVIDTGGFINLVIVAQGEYDPAQMRKAWEGAAAAEGTKLTVTTTPRYTLYGTEANECFVQIDDKTIATVIADEKLRKAFLAMLDQEQLPQSTNRCAALVKKLLADRDVGFASACEDAARGLFESDTDFKKKYDIVERTIAVRGKDLDFTYRKVHETAKQAKSQLGDAKEKRAELIEKNPQAIWLDSLRGVSLEQNDKEVRARGKLDAGVARGGLLEVVFFPED